MRYLLLFFSNAALAHPGHGKSGLFHNHSLADLFADGVLLVAAAVALGIVCWRLWKR